MNPAGERDELAYWLALRRAGLGSRNFALLLAQFSAISAAWDAPSAALRRAGLEAQYVRAFEKARATFDGDRELRLVEEAGARAYTWLDPDYPWMLREIPQSPPVLFGVGSLGPQFERAVAIVGTRSVTPYGRQVCEAFCESLAQAGVAIISGLARGVDSIAHRVALDCGAPTVAVLAGGIDQVYPRENQGLAERIRGYGMLVSEYPPGIPARPDYFPRRNRILSGLAQATLVIEAGPGSGALHTANWAFEQSRDVFAVPGSIFSRQSLATNQLIRENTARLVATPEQLLEELNLVSAQQSPPLAAQQSRLVQLADSRLVELADSRRAPLADSQRAPLADSHEPPAPVPPDRRSHPDAEATQARPAAAASAPAEQLTFTIPPDLPPDEDAILRELVVRPGHVDELVRATGLGSQSVSGALTMLEIKGLVRQRGPMIYEPSG